MKVATSMVEVLCVIRKLQCHELMIIIRTCMDALVKCSSCFLFMQYQC